MRLNNLSDEQLHQDLQTLVQGERELLTKILHHLKEVERRKLFSDFGCSSLFDYALHKLGYSEGGAHRRIQAMRLMRDLPEIEVKIASGELSLSNISQAQSLFNDLKKQNKKSDMPAKQKLRILEQLENKSAREGKRSLLELRPKGLLPKERHRQVSSTHTEVRLVMDDQLKDKLEDVRSLLGQNAAELSYAELMSAMADVCLSGLKAKRFGKKRTSSAENRTSGAERKEKPVATQVLSTSKGSERRKTRYIPQRIKHEVWRRDRGCCTQCGSRQRLNYDHVIPLAKNGETTSSNLRLLCFNCNQRAAMAVFGVGFIREMQGRE